MQTRAGEISVFRRLKICLGALHFQALYVETGDSYVTPEILEFFIALSDLCQQSLFDLKDTSLLHP